MVVMGSEGIWRGDGVEVGVVETADIVWGGRVEDETVDVVLKNLLSS